MMSQKDNLECGKTNFCSKQKCLSNIGMFTGVCSLSVLITGTLTIYMNTQITSIEKQFGLSSSESGLLMSYNDIGYLLFTLFAGFIAARVHVPRVLAASTAMFGLAGLLCTIPHFIFTAPIVKDTVSTIDAEALNNSHIEVSPKQYSDKLCNTGQTNASDHVGFNKGCQDLTKGEDDAFELMKKWTIAIIATGSIIQGIGKAPRQPMIVQFIDDNVKKSKTGFYLGIITSVGFLGPVLAYALGSVFSSLHVTLQDVDIKQTDPRWIGAWWLGFLVFGVMSIVAAIPVAIFPRTLNTQAVVTRREEASSSRDSKGKIKVVLSELKEMIRAVIRVLSCPLYILMMFASILGIFQTAILFAFLPKFYETQFLLPSWKANMILVLSRKVSSTPKRSVGALFILQIITTIILSTTLFYGCEQIDVIGVSAAGYTNNGNISSAINNTCVGKCECQNVGFFPVCGDEDRVFYSPCHAGCTSISGQMFGNCTCNADKPVVSGYCEKSCNWMYVFILTTFVDNILACMKIIPMTVVKIRAVKNKDKALGIGMSAFLVTLFGWLPGPLFAGTLIDTTCLIWAKSTCGKRGACLLYDVFNFRMKVIGYPLVFRVIMCLLYLLIFLKVRRMVKWNQEKEDQGIVKGEKENGIVVHELEPLNVDCTLKK